MNIKSKLIIASIIVVCFILSFIFVRCAERKAQERINKTTIELENVKAESDILYKENELLKDTLIRTNKAIDEAFSEIFEAQQKHDERIEAIEQDPKANDWLKCDIPNVVRDSFKDYCSESDN